MKKLKAIIALVLLTLWVPATSHCLLESAELIQTHDCCSAADSPCSNGSDCGDDCKSLESASYKEADHQQLLSSPILLVVLLQLGDKPLSVSLGEPSSLAPDRLRCLTVTWQFSYRTALPGRAPSFLA